MLRPWISGSSVQRLRKASRSRKETLAWFLLMCLYAFSIAEL